MTVVRPLSVFILAWLLILVKVWLDALALAGPDTIRAMESTSLLLMIFGVAWSVAS